MKLRSLFLDEASSQDWSGKTIKTVMLVIDFSFGLRQTDCSQLNEPRVQVLDYTPSTKSNKFEGLK